jgi:F-type H+-transporting ATPase subunit beta
VCSSDLPVKETVSSFMQVLEGKYDHLPEGAFYMVGNIDTAAAKGKEMEG